MNENLSRKEVKNMATFKQFLDSFLGYERHFGNEKDFNLLIRVLNEDGHLIKHYPACSMYEITYEIVKKYGDCFITWCVLEYAIEIRIHYNGFF